MKRPAIMVRHDRVQYRERNCTCKFVFAVAKNSEKGMFTICILKTPHPGQRPTSF